FRFGTGQPCAQQSRQAFPPGHVQMPPDLQLPAALGQCNTQTVATCMCAHAYMPSVEAMDRYTLAIADFYDHLSVSTHDPLVVRGMSAVDVERRRKCQRLDPGKRKHQPRAP